MKLLYAPSASRAFADAPLQVQKAFLKQVALLQQNLRHPSLRVPDGEVEAPVAVHTGLPNVLNLIVFLDDTYLILDIIPHPK